ncbi:MAG TPA: radical SAM protein, partial [Chloroflexota bacterium]|nr:radical SAM protein [Chloroflexota bacterium]
MTLLIDPPRTTPAHRPHERRLVDSFGRRISDMRISVTDRCNFRCVYCMPEEGMQWLKRETLLSFEEIERLARIAVDLGIEEVRLTGGEP